MKTSIQIGKISGIPVKLHITLLIIIGFVAWSIGSNVFELAELIGVDPPGIAPGFQSYLIGIVMAVGLFVSVLIHEMAHSFTARGMGVEIKEISLWLFGGVANMGEIPREPNLEIKLSIVGPLTSLGIGIICYSLGMISPPVLSFVLVYLGVINIILAAFNMIPAFPMDGGRILRAMFAKRESYVSATNKAASVGKVVAVLIGIFGIFYNFFLILIAFFIYMGASQEAQSIMVQGVLEKIKAEEIMSKDVETVEPHMSLQEFIDHALEVQHTGYPVMEDGKVVGIITLRDAKKIDRSRSNEVMVEDVMEKDVIYFAPGETVNGLWQKMVEEDIGRFPIVFNGELVGMVTRSDILRSFKRLNEIESYKGDEI